MGARMNNNTQESSAQQPGQGTKNTSSFSALDRTFPSVWIVAGVVTLVCMAVVVMGWKVIGLETEQEQVVRERLFLAEQRLQHQEMLQTLPTLRENHAELEKSIAILSGERDTLQLRIDKSIVDLHEATDKRDAAVITRNTAKEEERQIGDSVAQLKAQLAELTPMVRQLGQQEREMRSLLETLDKQRETLHADIARLQTQKQDYELTTQGLATQIDNRREALAAMTNEQGELVVLSRGFQEALDHLESAGRRADGTFTSLEQGTNRLSQATQSVEERSKELTEMALGVEQQTDGLKSSIEQISAGYNTLNAVVTELQIQPQKLRVAVQDLETVSTSATTVVESLKTVSTDTENVMENLEIASSKADTVVGRLETVSTSATTVVESLKTASSDTETVAASLENVSSKADTVVGSLETVSMSATIAVDDLKKTTKDLEQPKQILATSTTSLQNHGSDLEQHIAHLKTQIGALNTATEEAQTLIRSIESGGLLIKDVGEELEAISKSVAKKLETLQADSSDLGATNRQLSTTTTNLAERTADLDVNISVVKKTSEKLDDIVQEAQVLQDALINVSQTMQTSMQPIDVAGSMFSENVTQMQNDQKILQELFQTFQGHIQDLAQAIASVKDSAAQPSDINVTQ
jgi:chromosome segregation ATPase